MNRIVHIAHRTHDCVSPNHLPQILFAAHQEVAVLIQPHAFQLINSLKDTGKCRIFKGNPCRIIPVQIQPLHIFAVRVRIQKKGHGHHCCCVIVKHPKGIGPYPGLLPSLLNPAAEPYKLFLCPGHIIFHIRQELSVHHQP